MRVIAGRARGTNLISPEGLETRPTSDRIKESLFNMISFDLQDARFLDLFSGTGGIGIEALSRGAKEVVFVDESKEACACIQSNLEKTRFIKESTVLSTSVEQALNQLANNQKQFDIIFMDPPYYKDMIDHTLDLIIENNILVQNGYIIVEQASSYPVPEHTNLTLWKEKKYGTTTMSFFERKEV